MTRSYPKKITSTADFVQFLSKITWNSSWCFMHASVVLPCLVTQSRLILCDPMDCSPPGSSVPGIFQAKILEQVAISFSRGSPDLGIELPSPVSPALQANSLSTEPLGFGGISFSSPFILIFHSLFQHLRCSIAKGSSWIHEHTHTRQSYATLKRRVEKAEKNAPVKPRYRGPMEKQRLVKAWEFIISHGHLYHCQIRSLT